jgi:hypothetical protein
MTDTDPTHPLIGYGGGALLIGLGLLLFIQLLTGLEVVGTTSPLLMVLHHVVASAAYVELIVKLSGFAVQSGPAVLVPIVMIGTGALLLVQRGPAASPHA